jgi:hypothetical protein
MIVDYRVIGHEMLPFCISDRNKKGQFIAGFSPWNKGKKGINTVGSSTQFKKGNEPANTKHDGAISTRLHKKYNVSYKYIRVSKGNWQLLHRYIWEQTHGAIPANHNITFLDGDTLNCDINNLKCISKKDNLERNRNYTKMSATMKGLWKSEKIRTKYGLKRKTKLRIT